MGLNLHPLSLEFRRAAESAASVLGSMTIKGITERGYSIGDLPVLDRDFWNGALLKRTNCYNFAINSSAVPNVYPGITPLINFPKEREAFNQEFLKVAGDDNRFPEFAQKIHEGMISDGHIFTGSQIELRKGSFPVALFLAHREDIRAEIRGGVSRSESHDMHFYALRRPNPREGHPGTLLWAHKTGDVAIKTQFEGADRPFYEAQKQGYKKFGGFWLVKNPQLSHK